MVQRKAAAAVVLLLLAVSLHTPQRAEGLGLSPIVDYLLPIWPTLNCFNPARSDSSAVVPSVYFTAYLTHLQNIVKTYINTGLYFTAQCKASLILHGVIECYYVFDTTSYRTGLNAIRNTVNYNGISLNFCALQLDGGPVKTSTLCFDNAGLDPNHPYVIAKVQSAAPEYNLFQTLFGASVHDASVGADYTISFQCYFV